MIISESGTQEANLNGPMPVGLVQNPSSDMPAAGPMNSSVALTGIVPNGSVVLMMTVSGSGVSTDSTCAQSGFSGPSSSSTRSRDALTSAEVNPVPSWNCLLYTSPSPR